MGAAFPLVFSFQFGEEEPTPEPQSDLALQIYNNQDGKWIHVIGNNGNVSINK